MTIQLYGHPFAAFVWKPLIAAYERNVPFDGRKGSFILQHTATMNRGEPSMDIHVVPDSGTDELAGLAGDFKIQIVDGKHHYEFNYRYVEQHAGTSKRPG